MSTYTDLKNRVKETITVGFRPEDRVTTQKVRFYNEENEYWGSFSGSLSGNIDIYKGKLSSVDIYNATLVDPVIKTSGGMIIELGQIANQLEELSAYAHEDLSDAISSCIKDIRSIRNAISAVSADTADQLSCISSIIQTISSLFDDEVSARISSDERIEKNFTQRITELAISVAIEDKRLRDSIDNLSADLSNKLDSEVSARISSDEAVSASLMSYADRRRHYEISSMNAALQMPIKAKEFAVNKLVNYDLPDGFIVDDYNQIVGSVEGYDEATGDCKFTAYYDADYENKSSGKKFPYASILGRNSYRFDSSTSARLCPDAVHELAYVRAADPSNFEHNQFNISVMMPNTRTVKHKGRTIGFVYDAGVETSVSAGWLRFIPSELIGDSNLSSFAKDVPVHFSMEVNGGKISDDSLYPNCDLQLISAAHKFHYRAQISSWQMKLLGGGFEQHGARIYRDLWTEEEGGPVSRFAVSMTAAHDPDAGQQDFYLNAPYFESILHEYDDRSFDLLKYDAANKTISYVNEKKYLSCLVRIEDNDKQFDLQLSSLDVNTVPLSASLAKISFMPLYNAVNDSIKPLLSAGPYKLNRAGGVLSCDIAVGSSDVEKDGDVTIQIYNTGDIFAKFQAADGNTAVFGNSGDYVDFYDWGVCSNQSTEYGKCEFDADDVDFDQTEERCAEEGSFDIGSAASEGDGYTGLAFRRKYHKNGRREYGVNDIVIEIPDKADGSIESREFLFVIRPCGDNNRKATISFVTPQGDPIKFFAEGKSTFEIDCNKFITFRLQEITYGKFVLLDWDQSMQESRLDYLEATLSSEISNRISAVSDLSVKLSGEIDSLSTALSGEIDSLSVVLSGILSAHDSRISANRKDINFLLSAERKSMVYLGTLLSVDTGIDKHLSCYFQHALGMDPVDPSFKFKHGFTFRISAEQTDLYGSDDARISFYPSDVLTFNRDTELSAVCAGDVDVINDYNAELYDLSVALCAEIQNLSTALSGEIDSLSTALSGEIDSLSVKLSSEIDSLSTALSDEIQNLSTALSGELDDLSVELTGMISAVSSELSIAIDAKFALNTDLSVLSGNFCKLSGFIDHTLLSVDDNRPGIMKLRDEFDYAGEPDRNYEMHMISGTIMLRLI